MLFDFVYQVYIMVGYCCRGVKVNGCIVLLIYCLCSGDCVEILIGKEVDLCCDWLMLVNGFLVSNCLCEKVCSWFYKLDCVCNVQVGCELFECELKWLGLQYVDLVVVVKKFYVDSVDDLYIQVVLGDIGLNQVSCVLLEVECVVSQFVFVLVLSWLIVCCENLGKFKFIVQGVGNLLVQLVCCCQLVVGELIVGYLICSWGVIVYCVDCVVLVWLVVSSLQCILLVEWGQVGGGYEVDVVVDVVDCCWLLKDIINLIVQEDVYVFDIYSDNVCNSGCVYLWLCLKVSDYGQLLMLLGKFDVLLGVSEVCCFG